MANEILANLLETGVLSEEASSQIKEALDKKTIRSKRGDYSRDA